MQLRHPSTIARVGVLVPAPWKRYTIAAFFVVLYSICGKLAYDTSGEPYTWAIEEQKRLIREKASLAKEKGVSFSSGTDRKEAELEIGLRLAPIPNPAQRLDVRTHFSDGLHACALPPHVCVVHRLQRGVPLPT